MIKKISLISAIMATLAITSLTGTENLISFNACQAASYSRDRNSDGYIYKGTIVLTRVKSGIQEKFYLFNKQGVEYVATSKSGPFYRLARRMTINGIEYKY